MKRSLLLGVALIQATMLILTSRLLAENRFANLNVDINAILNNGCKRVEARDQGESPCCVEIPAHLDCSQLGLERKYGCSQILEVPNYLGGLDPKLPIVECVFYGKWGKETNDGIRYKGAGMIPVYNKYIVFPDEGLKVLNNPSEFKKFFVPIETPEEALSYAAALTGSYPLYRIEIPKAYKREASSITSTYVEELTDGFKVHLFDYKLGGCGPHYHYSVDYFVGKDGNLKELTRQNVWRNPKDDRLCVD
jgi:hypothetical protein